MRIRRRKKNLCQEPDAISGVLFRVLFRNVNLFCLFLLLTNKIDDLICFTLKMNAVISLSVHGGLLYWFYHAIYIFIYTINTTYILFSYCRFS